MNFETASHGGTLPAPGFEWGEVDIEGDRIAIIATGPSVQALDLDLVTRAADAGVHIIAVNNAITWLPAAHSWLTLDPGTKNQRLMRDRRPGVRYFAGVPEDFGKPDARKVCHRHPAPPGVTYFRRLMGWPPAGRGLTENRQVIRSGNSAFGALGAAYLARPERIGLFGVDAALTGYAYAGGRPSGRLWHMDRLFGTATRQLRQARIEVVNGSPLSAVTRFRRCPPDDAMEWLIGD